MDHTFLKFIGSINQRDVGKTLNKIAVKHGSKACDVQAFRVLFQHPKWFIAPINHRNVWYQFL